MAASVCATVRASREARLEQEGSKDLATHLYVTPMKACLQLDLQKKSDISAHCSTSPCGRGLEARDRAHERNRENGRQRRKLGKSEREQVGEGCC